MNVESSLADKVVATHRALDGAKVPHAFGGALALAYYAEPRATADIDINVFAGTSAHAIVVGALSALGEVDAAVTGQELDAAGQARIRWGRTPIDLFYAYDAFHDAMHERVRTVPFGNDEIPILAPEHLLVCKAFFDRPRDWVDIDAVRVAGTVLEPSEANNWMRRLAGDDDPRTRRLSAALSGQPRPRSR